MLGGKRLSLCWGRSEEIHKIKKERNIIIITKFCFVLFCFHSKQPNDYVSLGLLSGRKSKKVNAWEWVLKEKGKQNEKLGNAEELFCHLNKFA